MEQPEVRLGCQTPTKSVVLPYSDSLAEEIISCYEETGRTVQEWQRILLYDICAIREDGLWTHTKCGYSIPRRNGKSEILTMIELWAIRKGMKVLHTAHRVTTSSSSAARLAKFLTDAGFEEVQRTKRGEVYDHHFTYSKLKGLEQISIMGDGGGSCSFRTRTAKGGLGEGFDTLVIDEAQEYTTEQESSLKYVVSDSKNPQTIYCGTPPTKVSGGDVFEPLRERALYGESENTFWAEWSVDEMTDTKDKEAWYQCNPSLGTIISERSILDEIGNDDEDFNIQRLGLWLANNQKSIFSENLWNAMQLKRLPKLENKMCVGVKYGNDGINTSVSIAIKLDDNKIFVEAIDCRPKRSGDEWLLSFLNKAQKSIECVVIDGQGGQKTLSEEISDAKIKVKVILPTTAEVVQANSMLENNMEQQKLCHMGQPSLTQIVTNCDRRDIGTSGGFGYKSILDGADISLLDSMMLAQWQATQMKDKVKRKQFSY